MYEQLVAEFANINLYMEFFKFILANDMTEIKFAIVPNKQTNGIKKTQNISWISSFSLLDAEMFNDVFIVKFDMIVS